MFTKSSLAVICVFALYLSLFETGVTGDVLCYNCTSYPNFTECSSLGNSSVINCSEGCMTVTYLVGNDSYIDKGCASNGTVQCPVHDTTLNTTNETCTTCLQPDYCNSSAQFGLSVVTAIVVVFSVYFLK